jgi:hypothetical protein
LRLCDRATAASTGNTDDGFVFDTAREPLGGSNGLVFFFYRGARSVVIKILPDPDLEAGADGDVVITAQHYTPPVQLLGLQVEVMRAKLLFGGRIQIMEAGDAMACDVLHDGVEARPTDEMVWCAFFERNLHSRMPLSFTPLLHLQRSGV